MRFLPRAAFVAAVLAPAVAFAQVTPVVGDWYGTLVIPSGPKLALVFHVKPDGSATMDSPNQMAKGMPAAATLANGKVTLSLSAIPAGFEGALSADGQTLQGQWLQGGGALPLTMSRTAPVLNRPQTPKPPFPYRAEDVSYRNPASGLTLAGTLTLPEGAGPFPAVVLITGSGAQDRDETVFGHKPFWVIADALTRKGVAVLRVDDRGTGGSQAGPPGSGGIPALVTDVAAGVAFLRARADIDPARIGLVGHSEGGQVAPLVAAEDPRVAFLVLMAAPGVDGATLLVAQNRALFAASGMPDDQVETLVRNRAERFAAVRDARDVADARVRLTEVLNRQGLAGGLARADRHPGPGRARRALFPEDQSGRRPGQGQGPGACDRRRQGPAGGRQDRPGGDPRGPGRRPGRHHPGVARPEPPVPDRQDGAGHRVRPDRGDHRSGRARRPSSTGLVAHAAKR
ncbi:alpha/beta fold hydrolase [Caulobacter segnis]